MQDLRSTLVDIGPCNAVQCKVEEKKKGWISREHSVLYGVGPQQSCSNGGLVSDQENFEEVRPATDFVLGMSAPVTECTRAEGTE